MLKAEAKTLVIAFAATANEPVLNDGLVEIILSQCLRVDSAGLGPIESGYVNNYDANYAIMLAWEMKAGLAAGQYTFLDGGSQFIRSDMIRHCQQMADRWRRGIVQAVPIGSADWHNYLYSLRLIYPNYGVAA